MKNLLALLGVAAVIVAAAFSGAIGRLVGKASTDSYFASKSAATIDAALLKAASDLNAKLPIMVDSETRLDSTLGLNKSFRYNYTLVNHSSATLSAQRLNDALGQKLVNHVCTSSEMASFVKSGITVSYAYFGNDGKQIAILKISPSQCSDSTAGANHPSQNTEQPIQNQGASRTLIQQIPGGSGVSVKVVGISDDGQMFIDVANNSSVWTVTSIYVELVNTDQYAAQLRDARAPQVYRETYTHGVNVSPGSTKQFRIPVRWNPRIGFLVLQAAASGHSAR